MHREQNAQNFFDDTHGHSIARGMRYQNRRLQGAQRSCVHRRPKEAARLLELSLRGGPLDLWRCRCGFCFWMPASVCCSVSHAFYAAEAGFLGFTSAVDNAILSVWFRYALPG